MAGTWGNVSDLRAAEADSWLEKAKNETQAWLANMGYTPTKPEPALSVSLPTAEEYHASAPWRDLDPPKASTASPMAPVDMPGAEASVGVMPSASLVAGTPPAMPQGGGGTDDLEGWARSEAKRLGIDPEVAVRVANTEGGFADPTRQNMEGAPAYGPYQMYVGGPGNPGLGDEMLARGLDPRKPEHARAAVTFALEHAAKNGWGAFQGAAANGIGEREGIGQGIGQASPQSPLPAEETPQAQRQGAFAAGSWTPNQINAATSEGLDYETALAVCGPAAAIAFARKTGRNPTMQEALGLARQAGWTVESGMAGPASQQRLLESMGVAARLQDGPPDWQTVASDVQRGNPVILSTPGHYFVAERYNPETGEFDFGESAAVLKASGGRRWFRPEELPSLGMGEARASLFMDSPQSPSPSVVAGRTTPNGGVPAPSSPPAAGSGAPSAGAGSPLDDARASTGGGATLMRQTLGNPQPMPTSPQEGVSSDEDRTPGPTMPGRFIPSRLIVRTDANGQPIDALDDENFQTPRGQRRGEGPNAGYGINDPINVDDTPVQTWLPPGTRNRAVPGVVDEVRDPAREGTYPDGTPRNSAVSGDTVEWTGRPYEEQVRHPNIIRDEIQYRQSLSEPADMPAEAPYDPRDADSGPREALPGSEGAQNLVPYGPGLENGAPEPAPNVAVSQGGPPPADAQWIDAGPLPERIVGAANPAGQIAEPPPELQSPSVEIADGRVVPPSDQGAWTQTEVRPLPAPAPTVEPEPQIAEQSMAGLIPVWNPDHTKIVEYVQGAVQGAAEAIKGAGTAAVTEASDFANRFVNGPQVGGPNDGPQPIQGFPGEPDYQPRTTRVEAAQQRSAERRGLPIGERLQRDLGGVVDLFTGPPSPEMQEAGSQLQESVRSVGEPIIRPVEGAIQGAATAAEQVMGAPPGSLRQAAEDVSNFFPGIPAVGMVRRSSGMADDAGRVARSLLPEGAQTIKETAEAAVSRLRLDKFPEEVRADIEAAAKGINFAHEQRRGVLPDAVVQQMAGDDLRSVDQLIKGGKIGKAYNAEETAAVRNAVASQAQVVRELSEEIATARVEGMAPELLIARRAAEATKLDGLVQIAEGARAEAGRTLRAYRQQARLIELNPNEAIERIYKKLGGRDNATEAVDEYTKMVQDGANPIQLAKFWAKVEAGKITGSDLFALYRRFNMLSGPRTFEVNALSGAVNLGYEVLSSAFGTAARGRSGEAAAEIAAPFKASGRAFKNLIETVYHGVSTEQAARGDIPRTLSSRTDNPVAKGALTVMETPDRFNAGVDQFFRTMTEDWAATRLAHQQAREAGLSPRSKQWAETVAQNLEMIRDDPSKFPKIKEMADHVTFSEEPGGIGKGLEAFRQKAPLVANLLFPFIRTPYNIASRAIDISPLGIVRTGIETATGLGRGRENLAPRLRDNVLGTAAAVWAYDQAKQGNITGAGPDDPEKTAQLRATGWQPYSVKIGDQYWSYANFAPFNLALSSAAGAYEAQKYAKPGKTDTLSMLSDGAARTAKVVTDMTVLAGLGAVVKSIQDPDRYGTQWLSQFLQTLVTAGSALNTVGQATDPLIRRSERTDVGTQVSQNLQARVPGLRQNVPAAQDPLGRPIPNEQTGLGALNPFRPTTEREDPALQLFIDAGVDIGAPKQSLTVRPGTAPIALTPAEQRRWNELRGEQLQKTSPKLLDSPGFQKADKVGRETVMKRILNAASESADRLLIGEIGSPEVSRRLREAVQQKRAS